MFHATAPISPRSSNGFSLVEMSVVVGIIGFIAGGIIVGMNLKHSAELKAVQKEVVGFAQAVDLFRKKYEALPGDFYNAQAIWGIADASAATCKTTASSDQKTCNGDGNGWVGTPGDSTTYYESHRFWQQLANEGLIGGKYTGAQTATVASTVTCKGSSNCAVSTLANGLYYAATVNDSKSYFKTGNGLGAVDMFDGDKKNAIVLFKGNSSNASTTGAYVGAPLLTPEEAFQMDGKVDDGRPATGAIQTFEPDGGSTYLSTTCATSAAEASATYNILTSSVQCALIFTNAF